MSTTPAIATPPAPVASDVTYTEAQLNAAIEKARKDEGTKFAAELETLRAENTKLSSDAKKLATDFDALKNTAETLQKAVKSDGKIDVSKLIEEVSERVAKSSETAYAAKMTELEKTVNLLTTQLKTKELTEVRARLIAEAGGSDALIPELVKGNTEAELIAAIADSKAIFEKTKARFAVAPIATPPAPGSEVKPVVPAAPAGATVVPAATTAPSQVPPAPAAAVELSATNLRPLSPRSDPAQWKMQRQEALRQLEGRYASTG